MNKTTHTHTHIFFSIILTYTIAIGHEINIVTSDNV